MMASTVFLSEINDIVKDIVNTRFEFTETDSNLVPSYEDPSLTFENGSTKRGKTIETCILYVDIRDSVAMNNRYKKETMGKLYTAFIKSVLYIVDFHDGSVRNIIGDRVMAVFPKKYCFTNAVDCAVTIHTVVTRIFNKHFNLDGFKCGIGIDYGDMAVFKNGIIKQGKDRTAYKNLVWIGKTANIASRLTDLANKEIKKTIYRVTRNPNNPNAYYYPPLPYLGGIFTQIINPPQYVPGQPLHLSTIETVDMTPEEFASNIWQSSFDKSISTLNGKMLSFEKKEIPVSHQPILMTEAVYNGFKLENPSRDTILKNYWTEQKIDVKDYSGKVFGGNVYWLAIDKVNI